MGVSAYGMINGQLKSSALVKIKNSSPLESRHSDILASLRRSSVWAFCLLTLFAQIGCTSLAPDARSARAEDRDARAVEGGYNPGGDMPHHIAKVD